jgi:hypothetical protein
MMKSPRHSLNGHPSLLLWLRKPVSTVSKYEVCVPSQVPSVFYVLLLRIHLPPLNITSFLRTGHTCFLAGEPSPRVTESLPLVVTFGASPECSGTSEMKSHDSVGFTPSKVCPFLTQLICIQLTVVLFYTLNCLDIFILF